jgi:hypothetical protein
VPVVRAAGVCSRWCGRIPLALPSLAAPTAAKPVAQRPRIARRGALAVVRRKWRRHAPEPAASCHDARHVNPLAAVSQAAGLLAGALAGCSVPVVQGTLRAAFGGMTGVASVATGSLGAAAGAAQRCTMAGAQWLQHRVPEVPPRHIFLMHSVQLRL